MSGYGGGFMTEGQDGYKNSPAGGGGTNGKKGDGKGKFSNNQILPVTIKQLLTAVAAASGDTVVIDNVEVAFVRFVACVADCSHDNGAVQIGFCDGTYPELKVSKFVDPSDVYWAEALNVLQQLVHVEAVCKVQTASGQLKIDLVSVRAVTDPNAITHHLTAVMHLHLANTRGHRGRLMPASSAGAGSGSGAGGGYMGVAQAAQYSAGFASTSQHVGGGGMEEVVCTILKDRAMAVDQGVGVSLDELWAEAAGKGVPSRGKLQDILGDLCIAGTAYTCSDENHFLPT